MSKMLMLCGGIIGGVIGISCGIGGAVLAKSTNSAVIENIEDNSLDVQHIENNSSEMSPVELKEKRKGWHQNGTSWCYYKDGKEQTGWVKDNNKWYYLGDNGKMKTGWVKDEEQWYYLNTDGVMVVNITEDGFYVNDQVVVEEKLKQKSNWQNNNSQENYLIDASEDSNFLNNDSLSYNSDNITKETSPRGSFVQDSAEAKNIIYSNDPGNYNLVYKGIISSGEINNELLKFYENLQLNESVHVFYIYDENNVDINCIYYVGKSTGTLYRRNGGYDVFDDVYMIKNNEIVNVYNFKQEIF